MQDPTPMMLPLCKMAANDTLIWQQDRTITRQQFMQTVLQLAARLPSAQYVINLCQSRWAFMLHFIASAIRGQINLLPPNQAPHTLDALQHNYHTCRIATDDNLHNIDLNSEHDSAPNTPWPQLPRDQVVAILFTSGSTGTPQAQHKTWGMLTDNAALDAQCFVQQDCMNIVATVPAQHMFGLQMTALLPLWSRCAVQDSKPFFPADIRAALEAIPAPRTLVITPAHLRACVDSGLHMPKLEQLISATAPMPRQLAHHVEQQWRTTVLEIYGSTETGTIATRRSTAGDWQLAAGAQLRTDSQGVWFQGTHVPQAVLLPDQLEILNAGKFRLLGRNSEIIKVAGKRASLTELTQALLSIAGVQDAVVFLPTADARPAALVVAPQLNRTHILTTLAEHIDPVFLPRPMILLSALPRNAVGKLTQAALLNALTSDLNTQT